MTKSTATISGTRPLLPKAPAVWGPLAAIAVAILAGLVIASGRYLLLAPLLVLPLILLWPVEMALGVFGMLIPFEAAFVVRGSDSSGGATLAYFAGAMAVGVLFVIGVGAGRLDRVPRTAYWFGAFLLWQTITIFWAVDSGPAIRMLPTAWSLYFVYLAGSMVRITEKEFRWITHMCVLGGCAAALYVLVSATHGRVFSGTGEQRATMIGSGEADPNGFAATLMLPIAFALAGLFDKSTRNMKLVMGGAFLLLIAAVLRTMSRGALVAILVMTLVYIVRFRVPLRKALGIAVVVVVLAFAATPGSFVERLSKASVTGGAGRTSIWVAGLHSLERYGLVGAGLNNFPVAYDAYAGYAPRFQDFGRASHNIYLTIAVEGGLLGVILFGGALWSQFRRSPEERSHAPNWATVSCEAACWALLAAAFFLDILWRKELWLAFLLLVLARKLASARPAPVFAAQPRRSFLD